ncbi:MAG: AAA family ATPase [Thermoproteota archaeon]
MIPEDQEEEFVDQWWYNRPRLRKFFAPLLYISSWQYRLWRFLKKPPEERRKRVESQARKIRKRVDFPKVTANDVIGRKEDFDRVMLSIYYHVLRDRHVRKITNLSPPKLFVIKGGSGSGKTFFAEACQREAFEAGLRHGILINYVSLKPEQVYTMWYGSSAQKLGEFFNSAFYRPSVVLIDEFQAFGKRFTSATETGMEETRVQTTFLERIDELQKRNYRTILLIATTEYEALTETLRRRGVVGTIDLDRKLDKQMLKEIAIRQCNKFNIKLEPDEIVKTLEDSVRSLGGLELTPADVVNAFEMVIDNKSAPLQKKLVEQFRSGETESKLPSVEDIGSQITLNDFRAVSRRLKSYATEERTEAAKKSVLRIKPKDSYKDVGGLYGIKEEVIKEISLALNPDLAVRARYIPPKGFIFYGAPGTGKTLLAKAIAGESDVWFYSINGPSILQGHYGDPEKTVRNIFEDARKNAPAIIFFDEIDSIAPRRGHYDPVVDRVTSQLLTEIDGFVPLTGVVVIGSTNRLEVIDPALLERFTRHFEFTYPKNRNEKREVVEIHLRRYLDCLHKDAKIDKILEVFEKKILSPRKIADAINDANRLRTKEIEAAQQYLREIKKGRDELEEVKRIYKQDLDRIQKILGTSEDDPNFLKILEGIDPSMYPLIVYHFEKAIENTEDERLEEAREMIERTVRLEKPEVGKAYGLVAFGDSGQLGGFVGVIEVVVNRNGSGNVRVVGSEAGESILASAQDAFIYLNSISGWRFQKYDVYVELVTPAKGMEKQIVAPGITQPPVSGPSAGLAIGIAMLSAFTNIEVDPSVVMTGAITTRGEVWPVGGLDYRGMGKIEAALADKYARKLILPQYNYDNIGDLGVEKMLKDRSIELVPAKSFLDAACQALVGVKRIDEILEILAQDLPRSEPRVSF